MGGEGERGGVSVIGGGRKAQLPREKEEKERRKWTEEEVVKGEE